MLRYWECVSHSAFVSENFNLTRERDELKLKQSTLYNFTTSGWVYFKGSMYLKPDTWQNWHESRKYCQQRGADLIIINNVQEQEFATERFGRLIWIGLSDLEQEGVWRWVDGSLLNTRHFSNCYVHILSTNINNIFVLLEIFNLTDERDELKLKLWTLYNLTSSDWVYFNGSMYLKSNKKQNWQESRKYCQQRGADLIIINNVQEQLFATGTFGKLIWIGLSDLEQEGVWRWVDGSLLNTSLRPIAPGRVSHDKQVLGDGLED
ncbi:hypothetical protein WMY93_023301 [Mugilogobius chulae]|uniref:C-type lectin domain-containing protein n=1 Tax=Mugilogobius chulae TaxID=88201 RepID=A0AAW0NEE1_9GOBI